MNLRVSQGDIEATSGGQWIRGRQRQDMLNDLINTFLVCFASLMCQLSQIISLNEAFLKHSKYITYIFISCPVEFYFL